MANDSGLRVAAWTPELDSALRAMVAQRLSTRVIAAAMALHYSTVARRIQALKLREEAEKVQAEPVKRDHLAEYKNARRGFVVPQHLELEYYALLKTGLPIAEVCQRLGITTPAEKRGE